MFHSPFAKIEGLRGGRGAKGIGPCHPPFNPRMSRTVLLLFAPASFDFSTPILRPEEHPRAHHKNSGKSLERTLSEPLPPT